MPPDQAAAGHMSSPGGEQQQGRHASNQQSAEFFLSNYRLGRTLGIGSFGKVRVMTGLGCRIVVPGWIPRLFGCLVCIEEKG